MSNLEQQNGRARRHGEELRAPRLRQTFSDWQKESDGTMVRVSTSVEDPAPPSRPRRDIRNVRAEKMAAQQLVPVAEVQLTKYAAMLRAIDTCHSLDEICEIRDQAIALVAYTREAKNTEAERKVTEIRWRAERRAGALLTALPQYAGARPEPERRRQNRPVPKKETLQQLGVSKHECSAWERLAAVDDAQFESALAKAKPSRNTETFLRSLAAPETPKADTATVLATRIARRLDRMNRDGTLALAPADAVSAMTTEQREVVREVAPAAIAWLSQLAELAAVHLNGSS